MLPDASRPVLLQESSFSKWPADSEKPRPSAIRWNSGTLLAVAYDVVPLVLPILEKDTEADPVTDPIWIALQVHCLYLTLLMLRCFTVPMLCFLQDLNKEVHTRIADCWPTLITKNKFHFKFTTSFHI